MLIIVVCVLLVSMFITCIYDYSQGNFQTNGCTLTVRYLHVLYGYKLICSGVHCARDQ